MTPIRPKEMTNLRSFAQHCLTATACCLLLGAACAKEGSGPPTNTGGSGGRGTGGSGAGGAGGSMPPPIMFGTPAGKIDTVPVECAAAAVTDAGGFTFEKIAEWRDDATAAYTMVHDDMCGPELRGIDQMAVPALEMRGLTATLGPFVQICQDGGLWNIVKEAQAKGHEIANHSFTHVNIRMENAAKEVTMAKAIFDGMLPKPVTFFIFPYDDFGAPTVEAVRMAGHIGARAGNRDDNDGFDMPPINSRMPDNDLTLEFDAWPRAYSKYASWKEPDILDLHVHYAIEKQGFAVREFHSVTLRDPPPLAGEGFGPVPLRTYEKHLDFLFHAWKANKVWTSTASTIIRYRQARVACKAQVAGSTITYDTADPKCTQFATPISVIVKTAKDLPGLKATQGPMATAVFVRKLGPSRFSVTADPTAGPVQLAGCMTAVSTVDPGAPMAIKPAPANSVCEIEQVKGMGGMAPGIGMMDNFERDPSQFQLLPNPAQKDGRNGSWSWYPQTVTIEMVNDSVTPTNRVLRYAGKNVGNWTGATLAFLGGNGAGACYDATAYTGLKFKIRGSVKSTMPPFSSSIVRLSVITAETQVQKYGGDFKLDPVNGTGHFGKNVQVTPEWTEVMLPFATIDKPAWGPSANFPMLALSKLQALDWGVDGTAEFEIFLDDIQLY
jgi:hypothetical protein